jgi:hypothetical protein
LRPAGDPHAHRDLHGTGRLDSDLHRAVPGVAALLPLVDRAGAGRSQRVRVEEALAVEGDAGEEAVVEDALEDVHVLRLAAEAEHPVVPYRPRDRGAGLGVRGEARQLAVVAEGLAVPARPEASGHVELAKTTLSQSASRARPKAGSPVRAPKTREVTRQVVTQIQRRRPVSVEVLAGVAATPARAFRAAKARTDDPSLARRSELGLS